MGSGYWTRESFESYSRSRGRTVTASGHLDTKLTDRQIYTQKGLHPRLDPKNVMRECCDCAEHPRSIPVILALDVTGSMGPAAAEVAKKMNEVKGTNQRPTCGATNSSMTIWSADPSTLAKAKSPILRVDEKTFCRYMPTP